MQKIWVFIKFTGLFLCCAVFAACQNQDEIAQSEIIASTTAKQANETDYFQTTSLRVTYQSPANNKFHRAAFVPNPLASWLGQIILLDDNGVLYRARPDGLAPKPITSPKFAQTSYRDVYGLVRGSQTRGTSVQNQLGSFLTINDNGKIRAFVESDDDGNFSKLPISAPDTNFTHFCSGGDPITDKGALIDEAGHIHSFKVNFTPDAMMDKAETGKPAHTTIGITTSSLYEAQHISDCAFSDNGTLYMLNRKKQKSYIVALPVSGKPKVISPTVLGSLKILPFGEAQVNFTGIDHGRTHLLLQNGADIKRLIIEDGITIKGSKTASFVEITSHNFGSTFNEGLIMVQPSTSKEQRLLFISLSYAKGELTRAP